MISLLRRRPGFRRLWAAGAVSLCGDWLSVVAVAVLALEHGGGPLAVALVFAAHTLPAAILSPVAGALVDRVDRRKVLVLADLLASCATAGMAIAAAYGSVPAVQLLLLARSAITSAVPPGEVAALRRLVGEGELVAANAILAATWSTSYVVGMFLGGVVAGTGGATVALVVDAASFAIAAALHASLPPIPVEDRGGTLLEMVRQVPRDTVVALRVAFAHRPLLDAVLGKTPLAIAGGAGWLALNLVAAVAEPFGGAEYSFGVLQAFRGAGTGVGPAAATWLIARGVREAVLQHAARVIMLAAIVGLAFARDPVTLALVSVAWGVGTGTNWVLCHVAIQRHAADLVIGRLAAFDELLASVAMALGAVLGAVVAEEVGLTATPLVGAALGVLAVIVAALLVARAPAPPPP